MLKIVEGVGSGERVVGSWKAVVFRSGSIKSFFNKICCVFVNCESIG